VDFMPVHDPTVATDRHRIVRMLRCVRGRMGFDIEIAPRLDYGREAHRTHLLEDGVVFEGSTTTVTLNLVRNAHDERVASVHVDAEGDVHGSAELTAGDMRGIVLETGTGVPVRRIDPDEVRELFGETVRYWSGGSRSRRTTAGGARRWLARRSR
jgi:hypothetical protein